MGEIPIVAFPFVNVRNRTRRQAGAVAVGCRQKAAQSVSRWRWGIRWFGGLTSSGRYPARNVVGLLVRQEKRCP